MKLVSTKWLFRKKSESVYKARLVARGFEQEELEDDDNYSPVAKLATFRVLLAVAVKKGYYIRQADIKCAYLYSPLNEIVYIEILEGVETEYDREEFVILLHKALYGLKNAPKALNEHLHEFLKSLGFTRLLADACLYILNIDGEGIYILVFVDDFIMVSSSQELLNWFKTNLCSKFKLWSYGDIKVFLGIRVVYDRDRGIVELDQEALIEKMSERFGITETMEFTPIEEGLKLEPIKNECDRTKLPYKRLLGCLMFLMLGMRADICFCVSYMSRFQDKASDTHFRHLMRVLKYLVTTKGLKIVYDCKSENDEIPLIGYADSDWANDTTDQKSTSGYCLKVFNCLVSWASKKQTLVSLSTVEAEYIALVEACTEFL